MIIRKQPTKVSFDIKFITLDQKHVVLDRHTSLFLRCFCSRPINLISKDTNIVFSITARQAVPFLRCFWSGLMNLISEDTNMLFCITARQASPFLSCFWSGLVNFILKDTSMVFCSGYKRDFHILRMTPKVFICLMKSD